MTVYINIHELPIWEKLYKLEFLHAGEYIVSADSESDAVDEIIDYWEENNPGMLRPIGVELEEHESPIFGGNHGRYTTFEPHEMRITNLGGNPNTIAMWSQYLETAVWATGDSPFDTDDISDEQLFRAYQDCLQFIQACKNNFCATCQDGTELVSLESSARGRICLKCDKLYPKTYLENGQTHIDYEQAGHDYWLTRHGHGAGFWDGGWQYGEQLTELAEADGTAELEMYINEHSAHEAV